MEKEKKGERESNALSSSRMDGGLLPKSTLPASTLSTIYPDLQDNGAKPLCELWNVLWNILWKEEL